MAQKIRYFDVFTKKILKNKLTLLNPKSSFCNLCLSAVGWFVLRLINFIILAFCSSMINDFTKFFTGQTLKFSQNLVLIFSTKAVSPSSHFGSFTDSKHCLKSFVMNSHRKIGRSQKVCLVNISKIGKIDNFSWVWY